MCNVIVTSRSLLWTLISIISTLALISSVVSPQWLIGHIRNLGLDKVITRATLDKQYRPTIGIFNLCTKLQHFGSIYSDNCATYVTGFHMPDSEFPHWWKGSLFLFSIACIMLTFTVVLAVFSLCVRRCCYRSIFTLAGSIQTVAGVLSVISLLLYPVGWASDRVLHMCGPSAAPYRLDKCHFGWSFYVCVVATFFVFVSALLSIPARISTTSRKVEEEILEGKSFICML